MNNGLRTDWLHEAKWGVFIHYLAARASSSGGAETDSATWNRRVDAFDVRGLVGQLLEIRAKYCVLTLGQNSGHYCVPNATYDRITGIRPSKCARRDLVEELHDALAPHGIRLMVYMTAGVPEFEPVAVERFEWARGGRCAAFQRKWESVIREWSLRWGRKVSGWWFDGCYFNDEMYKHPEEPNFKSFAAAIRAGNPDSLIAWNPGVVYPPCTVDEEEDYTAGEVADLSLVDAPGRRVGHAQFQVLTYLGGFWGEPPIRFTTAEAVAQTLAITNHGGVITWDAPPTYEGLLNPDAMAVFKEIGKAVDATRGRPDLPPPRVVRTAVKFTCTPTADTPGRLSLALSNPWPEPIRGEIRLATEPSGIACFEQDGCVSYDLAPGAGFDRELTFSLKPGEAADRAEAWILLSRSQAPGPIRLKLPSRERIRLKRIADGLRLDEMEQAMRDVYAHTIRTPQGRTLADVWLARSGGSLALYCRVADQGMRRSAKWWDGSCMEVFGVAEPGDPIHQLFLAPATPDEPARAMRLSEEENASKANIVPAPEISFASWSFPGGYASAALIPLDGWLKRADGPESFLFEIAVSAGVDGHTFGRSALFGNLDAAARSDGYAIAVCE